MRGKGGGMSRCPLPGPGLPPAPRPPCPAGSIARPLPPTRVCLHTWAPWPRTASHSEGDIQITAGGSQ